MNDDEQTTKAATGTAQGKASCGAVSRIVLEGPALEKWNKVHAPRGAYASGKRIDRCLAECFPGKSIPKEMLPREVIRLVRAKHRELFPREQIPDRNTINSHIREFR
jgi:hypothetical protein